MRKITSALGITAVAVVLASCGTAATPAVPPAAPVTVTVAATSSEEPAPATVAATPDVSSVAPVTVTVAAPTSEAPEPASVETSVAESISAPAAAPVVAGVAMPDVVGMNLQAAQNRIQEAGVFYSRSEDATGAGRMQIVDSNWVVVAQTPAPGELIGEGDAMLSAKKIGE